MSSPVNIPSGLPKKVRAALAYMAESNTSEGIGVAEILAMIASNDKESKQTDFLRGCAAAIRDWAESFLDATNPKPAKSRKGKQQPLLPDHRRWKCPECGRTVDLDYGTIVEIGTPMCDCEDGIDMEMTDDMPAKPQMRLIVDMYGGLIECVYSDNPDVEITDVVFTEASKYLDAEDDRDEEGNLRFAIESGPLEGSGIFTHHAGVEIGDPEMFDPVMKAAERRANQG